MEAANNISPPPTFPKLYSMRAPGCLILCLVVLGGGLAPAVKKLSPVLAWVLIVLAVSPLVLIAGLNVVNSMLRLAWAAEFENSIFPWRLGKLVSSMPHDYTVHGRGYGRFGYIAPTPALVLEHSPTQQRTAVRLGSRKAVRLLEALKVKIVWHPDALHRQMSCGTATTDTKNKDSLS